MRRITFSVAMCLVPVLSHFDSHRAHGQSTSAPGMWQIVPSPDAAPVVSGNTLLAASARSATDVWAVGFHHNPVECTFCPAPLAMHWDGGQWSLSSTPTIPAMKAQLTAVAAIDSGN